MRDHRKAAWALAIGLLVAWAVPATAVVSDAFSAGDAGPHPKAIALTEAGEATVLTLSLPLAKGTKVHLARLYLVRGPVKTGNDLLAEIEVYPGKTAAGKPLAPVGAWFDHLDATDAVRSAVAAGGELRLFARDFPGWEKDKTRLEVWYDGKGPPPPAQVKDVRSLHRAGQTFITWKEVNPLASSERLTWGEYQTALAEAANPVWYRIYVHDKPVTAETIPSARLIADVQPLSAWNVNGRNIEYLIAQAMDKSDAIGELAENYASLMYTWGPDSRRMDRYPLSRFVIEGAGPLPVGTGLYVHTPGAAGKRYYAVVSCAGGVENLQDFSRANAPDKAVEETAGAGEPVFQGDGLWGPFFDYPGRRKVYVQWCAPPLAPLPSMYFNWSVLVPPERKPVLQASGLASGVEKVEPRSRPVELYFHSGGFSYARPRHKYVLDGIQIAPHDYPASGWYGFNSSYGTLKGYAAGSVSNHTQKRIIAFLDWAKTHLPVDPERITVTGGDGAAMLAVNYPDVFSYAIITGFESIVSPPEKFEGRQRPGDLAAKADALLGPVWGPRSPEVKDDQGRGDWGWAMLDALVAARPRQDLPLFSCGCPGWGLHVAGFGRGTGRFYSALAAARQPLTVNWSWGGGLTLVPDKYTGLYRGLDLARAAPVIAFSNCSADSNHDGNGQINGWCNWSDLKESPDGLEVRLYGRGTADVAPRRLRFKPKPGDAFAWESTPLPDPRAKSQPAPQGGQVVADANGVIVIPAVAFGNNGVLLKIARSK